MNQAVSWWYDAQDAAEQAKADGDVAGRAEAQGQLLSQWAA
jgi:hypothetical protein